MLKLIINYAKTFYEDVKFKSDISFQILYLEFDNI